MESKMQSLRNKLVHVMSKSIQDLQEDQCIFTTETRKIVEKVSTNTEENQQHRFEHFKKSIREN